MSHSDLLIRWSAVYHPEWDAGPQSYLDEGVLAAGKSRRLARIDDPSRSFKAYLGVHQFVPSPPKFFLSLFLYGRTVTLRTFATMPEARAALDEFHTRLVEKP